MQKASHSTCNRKEAPRKGPLPFGMNYSPIPVNREKCRPVSSIHVTAQNTKKSYICTGCNGFPSACAKFASLNILFAGTGFTSHSSIYTTEYTVSGHRLPERFSQYQKYYVAPGRPGYRGNISLVLQGRFNQAFSSY